MRYGMVLDLKKCIGCYGCQIFCKAENATPPGMLWSRVLFYESGNYPSVRKIPLPVLCMHCGTPACVDVCPTGASVKRPDGIVTVDSAKCIGCGHCLIVCPYGARHLYLKDEEYFPGQGLTPYEKVGYQKHTIGVAGKCDFCLPRIKNGLEPACVQNCMANARYFGDLDDPDSEVSQLIRDRRAYQVYPDIYPGDAVTGDKPEIDPSVYYLAP
jgi:molybdopterin-containing oxidoreductase family iron-sulfur binding subunit